jgi:hypothetical protein
MIGGKSMTTEDNEGLQKIRRVRRSVWIWVLSYVPVMWIVKRTTHSDLAAAPFVLVWAVAIVRGISRAMFIRCPRCKELFHSTHGSPTVWNLFTGKCMQCGLPLKVERVIYPSLE